MYAENGLPEPNKTSPLIVTIPEGVANTEGGVPTGTVFNGTGEFVVSAGGKSGSAVFLFAGEDGTISGWSPAVNPTQAIIGVDNSTSGAVHKGIALGTNTTGNAVFVTNFNSGNVDVYSSTFAFESSFTDSSLTALGYAPFGIANIGGTLFVTFALQNAEKHDDVAGPGHGYIDEFSTDGTLIGQFAAQGTLNSPWGMALAPNNFGKFSGALLVGNFGDGRINAFDMSNGNFLGQMATPRGQPLTIDGLWGLAFGNDTHGGGASNQLFFTAGPGGESHGLFGRLMPVNGAAITHGR